MKVLKLFENCRVTKGAQRSLILDTQRDAYYLIPNSLGELFGNKERSLEVDNLNLKEADLRIMKEYIDFIIEHELGFYCDSSLADQFPALSMEWDYPAMITNAIVEINTDNFCERFKIMSALCHELQTRYLEINIKGEIDLAFLEEMLDKVDTLDLYSYNLICSLPASLEQNAIRIIQSRHKIQRTIFHTATNDTIIKSDKAGWGNIFLTTSPFSYRSCGVTDKFNFSTTIEHLTEAMHHNTCLNRKLCIDIAGNIKNCPSMSNSFGNIEDTPLRQAIENAEFKQYWNITKDQIKVCRDCEFRHICTDCRAYIEEPSDIYSKPLKCGYDPYTTVWETWSEHPAKKAAIQYYQLNSIT